MCLQGRSDFFLSPVRSAQDVRTAEGQKKTSDLTARGVIARSGTLAPERSLTQWIMNGEVAERASLNTNYPARFIGSHKHARTDSTYSGSLVVDTGWRIDWAVCVRSRKLIALPYRRLSRPYPCWRESTPTEEARAFLSSAHSAPGMRTISREVDLRHAGNFMIMSDPGLATPKPLRSTWILGFLPLMWKGWQSQLSRGKDWNWFSFPQRDWTVELGQERCRII